MHIRNSILFPTFAVLTAVLTTAMIAIMTPALSAQAPATPAPAQTPPAVPTEQTPAAAPAQSAATPTAADLLQPALSNARSALMALKVDKWKKGSVRDEAEENVNTLLRDFDNNVQPLITAADAAPAQLSKAIPLIKHLDALYDVLLRVEEASRVSAPPDQIEALQGALLRVSQARIAYDDVLQMQAAGVEKQIGDLQLAVRAEQQNVKDAERRVELAKAAAKSEPCKPAAPVRRRRRITAAKKTPAAESKPPAQPQSKSTAQPQSKPPAKPPAQQPAQKPQ